MIFWRSVHQQLIRFCWWSRLRCGTGIFKRNFHCASACKARYRITNSASLSVRQCILSKTMDSGTWSYFWRSGRGILLVFDPYCRYKIPKGTLSGSIKLYRGGKLNYYGTLIGSSWINKINLAKVKKWSFSSFPVLKQRCVGHFACQTRFASIAKDFAISFVKFDVVWVAKVIAAWKFSTPSAFGLRSSWFWKNIVKKTSETALLRLFRCFPNRLVTYNLHCIVVNTEFAVEWVGTRII